MPHGTNGTTSREKTSAASRRLAGVSLVLVGLAGAGSTAVASPTPTPSIIGGQASTAPWVVQLVGRGSVCSAVAINPSWVITARHCPSVGEILFHSGSGEFYDGRAKAIPVAQAINSPVGDIMLLRLATPRALSAYPELNLDYVPKPGEVGTIYGIGTPKVGSLRQATVTVVQAGKDYYGGHAAHVRGINGAAYPGDSGGPLVVNGKVVGVASTSTISGIHSHNWYGVFAPAKEFFSRYVVGTPTLDGNWARLELGKEWFNSNQRIMIWVNGHHAAETFSGTNYYAWMSDGGGKVILRPATPVRAGDEIQVGVVAGKPGNKPPTPAAAQPLLAKVTLDAVRSVKPQSDKVKVEFGNWLYNAPKRVMFWINGKYVAETYRGSAYFATPAWKGDSVFITPNKSVAVGDRLQVGIVGGVPINNPPDPSSAQMLVDVVLGAEPSDTPKMQPLGKQSADQRW